MESQSDSVFKVSTRTRAIVIAVALLLTVPAVAGLVAASTVSTTYNAGNYVATDYFVLKTYRYVGDSHDSEIAVDDSNRDQFVPTGDVIRDSVRYYDLGDHCLSVDMLIKDRIYLMIEGPQTGSGYVTTLYADTDPDDDVTVTFVLGNSTNLASGSQVEMDGSTAYLLEAFLRYESPEQPSSTYGLVLVLSSTNSTDAKYGGAYSVEMRVGAEVEFIENGENYGYRTETFRIGGVSYHAVHIYHKNAQHDGIADNTGVVDVVMQLYPGAKFVVVCGGIGNGGTSTTVDMTLDGVLTTTSFQPGTGHWNKVLKNDGSGGIIVESGLNALSDSSWLTAESVQIGLSGTGVDGQTTIDIVFR